MHGRGFERPRPSRRVLNRPSLPTTLIARQRQAARCGSWSQAAIGGAPSFVMAATGSFLGWLYPPPAVPAPDSAS